MLINRPDLKLCREYMVLACAFSRAHRKTARAALIRYGDHGPDISGCVREHFPEHVKDRLRELAKETTQQTNRAYEARPKRVHNTTIRKLGQEIAARDGTGFYGP